MSGSGEVSALCSCEPEFRRSVGFIPTGYTDRITACLKCGSVDYVKSYGYEPRPGDIQHGGDVPQALDPVARDWLARWPRVFHIVRDYKVHTGYIPASMRYASLEALRAWETAEEERQFQRTEPQRLAEAGYPDAPCPCALEGELEAFRVLWESVHLSPEHDPGDLLYRAGCGSLSAPFATDALLKRPDMEEILVRALQGTDEERIHGAHRAIRAGKLTGDAVLHALASGLNNANTQRHPDGGHIQDRATVMLIIDTVLALRPSFHPINEAINTLRPKVLKPDPYLYGRLGETIQALEEKAGG